MKLTDESHGLPDTELAHVDLEGNALDDYRAFWERAAEVDAIRAIADQDDEKSFEVSGLNERDALAPLIDPSDRVLDIGCGIGRVMQHVAPLCAELHGVDISSEMVKAGSERLVHMPNVTFHVGNGYDLGEFDDRSFDVVYSTIALQHMPKTTAFNYIREAHRVLRPGGVFWFYVPNILKEDLFQAFNHFCQPHFVHHPYPMHFFTPTEIASFLVRTGFAVVSMNDEMVIHAEKAAVPYLTVEAAQVIRRPGPVLAPLLGTSSGEPAPPRPGLPRRARQTARRLAWWRK
jgi:ubiquinone/menaquinone biosynthesis C-methylase UbiE